MIGQRQLITSSVNGDCFRACIASILELNNSELLPNITEGEGWMALHRLLNSFGLDIHYTDACWINGYWIASVPSKNYQDGTTHAIVMDFTKVAYDPSNKRRYRAGNYLRSQIPDDYKVYGYVLQVMDASKLHLLDKYRRGQQ